MPKLNQVGGLPCVQRPWLKVWMDAKTLKRIQVHTQKRTLIKGYATKLNEVHKQEL
jgi:hypothetical protein